MCRLWQCKRNQQPSFWEDPLSTPLGGQEGHMLWSFGITISAILHPVQFSWGNLRRLIESSQGLLKTSLSGYCKKWVGTCCLRLSTTNGSSCLHPPVGSLLWNFNFHWTKRLIWVGCSLRHDETSTSQKLCCRFSLNSLVDEKWKYIKVKMPCKGTIPKDHMQRRNTDHDLRWKWHRLKRVMMQSDSRTFHLAQIGDWLPLKRT